MRVKWLLCVATCGVILIRRKLIPHGLTMTKTEKSKMRITIAMLALAFSLALIPASGGSRNQPQDSPRDQPANKKEIKGKMVYVCACLETKSCSCMTEAKT